MIHVIISSRNDLDSLPRSVMSAARYMRDDVSIWIVDNNSDDGETAGFSEAFAKKQGFHYKKFPVTLDVAAFRTKMLNLVNPKPSDVVIWLRGNMYLPDGVFDRVDELYSDGVKVTYGEVHSHRGDIRYSENDMYSAVWGQKHTVRFER